MSTRSVAVNFSANTSQYVAGVGKAALATGSLQSAAAGVVKGLVGPGALVFALTQTVKWANETEKAHRQFTSEMLKLQTQIGLTTKDTQSMSQAVLGLAGATTKAPQELAEAMFFVASAGLRGKEALDVLRSSAQLSAVGLGETKVIADLLTSAVNAYGSETLTAAGASDALVSAVRLGKLEADQLAGAMGRVLPIASAMGVSFDEVSGLMAAMSKTGTDAASATTQLRAIMVSLLKPTNQSVEAMTELGFTQQGIRDTIMEDGLFEALLQLHAAADGNTAVFAELFPNVRALSGVMDLLGPQLEGNIQLMRDHAQSGGVAAEAFALFAESSQSQVEELAAQQQRLAILQGEYQVGMRAAIRENRIMRTEARADRISFRQDMEGMTSLLLDGMVPAVDAFRNANFRSTEEMRRAMQTSPGVRQAFELLSSTVQRLHLNTDDVVDGLDHFTRAAIINGTATLEQVNAVLRYVEALNGVRSGIPPQSQMGAWERSLLAAARAADQAAEAEGDLADALGFTNEELDEQIKSLQGQLDMRLRMIDPVYRAIRAEQDFAKAQAEVNRLQQEGKEGTEEYINALYDLMIANLRMDSALSQSRTVIDRHVQDLNGMLAAGVLTERQVQRIIERLNEQGHAMALINGTVVNTRHVHTEEVVTRGGTVPVVTVPVPGVSVPDFVMPAPAPAPTRAPAPAPAPAPRPPTTGFEGIPDHLIPIQFRARGGPVSAGGAYIVGEEGPELMIPSGSGRVMSAPQTQSMLGGSTYNVTVNMPPGADGDQVVSALRSWERSNGPVPVGVR